jgi:hypothetical protein
MIDEYYNTICNLSDLKYQFPALRSTLRTPASRERRAAVDVDRFVKFTQAILFADKIVILQNSWCNLFKAGYLHKKENETYQYFTRNSAFLPGLF